MKSTQNLHAHWNTLVDNFNFSTKEFYSLVSSELKSKGISGVSMREKKISTGTMLSSKRLYLRVTWKKYTYDFCCAPFGSGTFFSWWLYSEKTGIEALLSRIPFIGEYLANFFYPTTYYSIDSASMFMTYAQSSVLAMIDFVTKEQGLRELSQDERKPIMRDIFKR